MKEILSQLDELYGGAKDKILVEVLEPWTVGKDTVMVKGWRLIDVQP